MRWALLGNHEPPHSTESECRKAIEANGWEVTPVQEGDPDALSRLTATAGDYDVVMWTRTASLAAQVGPRAQTALIDACEKAGTPLVGVHLDRWIGLRREREVRREPYFRVPLLLTADGGHQDRWADLGVNHRWLPPAVSEFECVPGTPRDEYRAELAFVGSWDGYGHREAWHRPALVAWLRENYGDRVAFWPKRGEHALRGKALRDLVASVDVFVGDSCILSAEEAEQRGRYVSDRVPELLGRGGFLIHPWAADVTALFPGLDCWEMGDWDALRWSIDSALADPEMRATATETAQRAVLGMHTYTVRVREIVDLLTEEGML